MQLSDAPLRAQLAVNSIFISDQLRAKPIQDTIDECSEILGIEPPRVYITRGSPNAYVSGLQHPHCLVLTSDLLDLYSETPKELRFIIGHELGHLKADHLRTHCVGRLCVHAIGESARSGESLTGDLIAVGSALTLLHWYRESEYSADRAGLLCVGGDLTVAQQALLRLIHQTKPSNPAFDPRHPNFDPKLVLQHSLRLREEPITTVLSTIRQMQQNHPFVPERCAALSEYCETTTYQEIIGRRGTQPNNRSIEFITALVEQIPAVDYAAPLIGGAEADPLLRIQYSRQRFATEYQSNVKSAAWPLHNKRHTVVPGSGAIVDLVDHNSTLAEKLIGSVHVPIASNETGEHEAKVRFRDDFRSPSTTVDRPMLTIRYRITE